MKQKGKIMYETLVNIETNSLAIKKGFRNYACLLDKWMNLSMRPSQSVLQKWLRETHNIKIVAWDYYEEGFYFAINGNSDLNKQILYVTYEESLEKGLLEGLNLIN